MPTRFEFNGRAILVRVRIAGPLGDVRAVFALDTGATLMVVSRSILARAGIEVSDAGGPLSVVTAGGAVEAPRVSIPELSALGSRRANFTALGFDLPRAVRVDGLLGLDFLRGHRLTIDFRANTIDLE